MLQVVRQVIQAVRRAQGDRPIFIAVDGLEKMNGEAPQRFREVFMDTRLILDTQCAWAIAAPPCTLTSADGAGTLGYRVIPVLGFVEAHNELREIVTLRLKNAGMSPEQVIGDSELCRLAEESGGLPRHLVQLIYESLMAAQPGKRVVDTHVASAVAALREELNRGLTSEDYTALAQVRDSGELPANDRAAALFANSQVLAFPPNAAGRYSYVVHPLLRPAVDEVRTPRPNE